MTQSLLLEDRLFREVKESRCLTTVRKGHRNIRKGPLVFEGQPTPNLSLLVHVVGVERKKLAEVNDEDAHFEGSGTAERLIDKLIQAYGGLLPESPVTVIHFVLPPDA